MRRAQHGRFLRRRLKRKEAEILRHSDENVLRGGGQGLTRVFKILASLPNDFLPKGRHDTLPQRREDI